MRTISNLDQYNGQKSKPNKVLEALRNIVKHRSNPTTLITSEYDKKLIRNTIASKYSAYMNWKEFWTLEFHDKEWHDIIMEQEEETLHIIVDHNKTLNFNLNKVWAIKNLIEAV